MTKILKQILFKIKFFFAKTQATYDFGSSDCNCVIFYKIVDNNIYVIKSKYD